MNPMRTSSTVLLAMLATYLPFDAPAAIAGTLRVAPVRVEVAPNKQFCSLSLSNDGAEPATMQIRGYGWTRDRAGNDLLDQAGGPTVNPSIIAIPAGETRLVRCSLPNRPSAVEESYRLIIDELPGIDPAPGTIRTLLRISIPVFRAPAGASPSIGWAVEPGREGAGRLVISNRGNRHSQVLAIILHPKASKAEPVRLTRGFYLLPGGEAELPLPSLTAGDIAAVEVETAQGRLPATLGNPKHLED
jgi:P pilus assembly protein, chaperone PapD